MRRLSSALSICAFVAALLLVGCEDSSSSLTGPTPVQPEPDPTEAIGGEG